LGGANTARVNQHIPPKRAQSIGAFEDGLTTDTTESRTQIWTVPHTWYMVQGRGKNNSQDKDAVRKWVGWAGSNIPKKNG
jgi:hypothetical protein